MAKRIVYSQRAKADKKQILSYWQQRNKSNTFSKKLQQQFKAATKIISEFPQIGELTDDKKARIKVVRDYLIIYEEFDAQIFILTIWDSRQDPDKLSKIL
jgi:toxin YoeB